MKVIRGSAIEFVPASHEDPQNPGVLKRVLATNADLQAGQVQMLNWARLPVGSSFASHYHQDMQEAFVILSGNVQMTVDDQQVELSHGDAILIDANEVHKMINVGDRDADYIVFGISSQKGGQTIVVD